MVSKTIFLKKKKKSRKNYLISKKENRKDPNQEIKKDKLKQEILIIKMQIQNIISMDQLLTELMRQLFVSNYW